MGQLVDLKYVFTWGVQTKVGVLCLLLRFLLKTHLWVIIFPLSCTNYHFVCVTHENFIVSSKTAGLKESFGMSLDFYTNLRFSESISLPGFEWARGWLSRCCNTLPTVDVKQHGNIHISCQQSRGAVLKSDRCWHNFLGGGGVGKTTHVSKLQKLDYAFFLMSWKHRLELRTLTFYTEIFQ